VTATMNARGLYHLLADTLVTVGDDDELPILAGVLLHTSPHNGGTVLVGTSTDRFTLGQAHLQATGELPEVLVPTEAVRKAVAVLDLASADVLAELDVDHGRLRITLPGMHIDLDPWDRNGKTPDYPKFATYPKFAQLFDTSPPEGDQHVVVDSGRLAQFVPIAERRGTGPNCMRIETFGPSRAVHLHIGDAYRALLMPVRLNVDCSPRVPLFTPPTHKADTQATPEMAAARG
jgi:hypothetical protein